MSASLSQRGDRQRAAGGVAGRSAGVARRPDLVLFPDAALPVAVEVELSVKASRRLRSICRAWAR